MPSFLSKVFGRKKADDHQSPTNDGNNTNAHSPTNKRVSPSLLEGKFEAVSATVSPSATHFANDALPLQRNDKEHDGAFTGLFRPKSRTVLSTPPQIPRKSLDLPHLTLDFSLPKTGTAEGHLLGSVFGADPDEGVLLTEDVIGARRLSPQEALILVRSCSQAIINHGLGSLGIMHPHWYSASPDLQRKLISLFIRSLDPSLAPSTSLPPTISSSPSPASAFATEIESVRSPHDVAAVLRWGIRHLRLDGTAFGTDTDWYRAFASAERRASYPARAFSDILVPLLPSAHADLLKATLQIISSLASHAEANGISGSKLTKFVGLWLLTINRSEPADDWDAFYARWERNGRILEHLFLAEIRDEDQVQKLPRRLTELIAGYPYGPGDDGDDLLPRPRLSTRRYPALYVLVETTVPKNAPLDVKSHPIRLLTDALGAAPASSTVEPNPTWDAVKSESVTDLESESTSQEKQIVLSRVFDDETIRLLSLLPPPPPHQPTGSSGASPAAPLAVLSPPPSLPPLHRRSPASRPGSGEATPLASSSPASHSRVLRTPPPSSFPSNSVYTNTTDWAQFSTSGFGESPATLASTLLDKDLEVTEPQVERRRSSRKRKGKDQSRSRRASVEVASRRQQQQQQQQKEEEVERTSKAVRMENVELDEAFVDFWADALLDPISSGFPAVVVCKLKGGTGVTSPVVASSPTVGPSSPSLLSSTAPTAAAAAANDTANDNNNNNNAPVDWLIVEQKLVHPSPPAPTPAPAPAPAPPASPSPPLLSSSPSPVVPAAPSPTSEEPASKRPRMRTGFGSGSSSTPSSPTVSGTARKRFSFFGGSSSTSSNGGGGISFVDKAKSMAGRRLSAAGTTATATSTSGTEPSASKMGRAASSSAALGGGGGFKVGEMGEVIHEEPTSMMTETKAMDEEVKTATTTVAAEAGLVGLGVGAVAAAASAVAATQDKDKEVEKAVAQPLPESPVGEPLAVLDETEEEEDMEKSKEPKAAAKEEEEEGKEGVVSPPLASSSEADAPTPAPTTSQEPPEVAAPVPTPTPVAQDTNESEAVVTPPVVPAEAMMSTDTLVPTPQPQEQLLSATTTTTDASAPEFEGAEVEETVVGDVTDIGSAAQHADEGVLATSSAEDAGIPVGAEKSVELVKEETEGAEEQEEKLPSALESVVLAGDTPGPQLALDTTEEEAAPAAVDTVEAPQEQADDSKAEEAEAAVDLPEVPIVDVEVSVPEPNHQETLLDEAEVVPVVNTEEMASPEAQVEEPRVEETVEEPVAEEPAAEEPTVEEPAVEEPIVEEPVVEEPALEESVVEEPAVQGPAVEEPVVLEPAAEEPIVEEPAAEEPVFEEPAIEEPAIEEPTVEEPTIEEPAATSEEPVVEPTADELITEEPAAEEPVIQEPSTEEPAVEEAASEESPVVEKTPVEVPSIFAEPVVEEEPTDIHEPVKEDSIAKEPAVEKHEDETAEASAPSAVVEETETGAEDTTEPSA